MARFLLIVATTLGFLFTIGFANLIVPILHGVHKSISAASPKKRRKGISWRASNKGIPTMGGLCILFASLLAVVVTIIGLSLGQSEFLQVDWTRQVRLAAISALLFALIGVFDDFTRVRRNQPAGMPELLKFLLQSLAVGVVLVIYTANGYLNTTTMLPVVGYYDFGNWFYAISYVFALFFVRCVEKTDGVDGMCTSCAFISVLGLLVLSVYFGSYEASVFPAALAGALLAFLFWNFHPAKISMGGTGSLFLAGAMFGIAQGLNWPGILWVLGLPYFLEGVFSLVQFMYYMCTGKRIFSAAPLHVFLAKKGWSEVGLIYLFSGVSVMGVIFTVLFIRLT